MSVHHVYNLYARDFGGFLRFALRWGALGSLVGVLAGTASAIFLIALDWATQTRILNPWLIGLLPLGGFLMGWSYRRFGGAAALGNNLVIDEVNRTRTRIPLRMAPMVLAGTVLTHLLGGSAGREGTAIQMGASLADNLRRLLYPVGQAAFGQELMGQERRLLIMAGIAGGFGSVFGVPAAGFVFGMEVQRVGRIRYEGLIPCMAASYIGDLVTRAWGAPHAHYPHLAATPNDPWLLGKVIVAGIGFGLTALLFIELIHAIKGGWARLTAYTPLYPVMGGVLVLGLTWLVDTTDYLGLSLPLIYAAVGAGGEVVLYAFALKLLFTAITLGSGYLGGEVTPLFVIGSTLGYTLGHLLGVDPAFLASIGLVAVFAGAANTPLACAIMGIELFGGNAALYLFAGCAAAYLASGHRGIYTTQRLDTPKGHALDLEEHESLHTFNARRGGGW
ncbi:MAG: chloride channel protein [Litorilinea sp.]